MPACLVSKPFEGDGPPKPARFCPPKTLRRFKGLLVLHAVLSYSTKCSVVARGHLNHWPCSRGVSCTLVPCCAGVPTVSLQTEPSLLTCNNMLGLMVATCVCQPASPRGRQLHAACMQALWCHVFQWPRDTIMGRLRHAACSRLLQVRCGDAAGGTVTQACGVHVLAEMGASKGGSSTRTCYTTLPLSHRAHATAYTAAGNTPRANAAAGMRTGCCPASASVLQEPTSTRARCSCWCADARMRCPHHHHYHHHNKV
jgi:hypothetical protein